jgi:hypothetical protein
MCSSSTYFTASTNSTSISAQSSPTRCPSCPSRRCAMTSFLRKFSKASWARSPLLLPPRRSTPRPSHLHHHALLVGRRAHLDSSSFDLHNSCCSSPARKITTEAAGGCMVPTVAPTEATVAPMVATTAAPLSSTLGTTQFKCGRVQGASDSSPSVPLRL